MKRTRKPKFIKGLKLSEMFFAEAVQPLLSRNFPGLAYSAALMDYGSEVLGFDTAQSMDHGWGPRVQLLLKEEDLPGLAPKIIEMLGGQLPFEFRGFSTNFARHEDGTARPDMTRQRPIQHGVSVGTLPTFFKGHLGFDLLAPLNEVDWLLIPQHKLRTISSGKIFHDGLSRLEEYRRQLAWYPKDLWLYLLACQWKRVSQEEPFMARCGDTGDELGSRIIGARMVEELMRLCFLMERRYAPYAKWFGAAFGLLSCSKKLRPLFDAVLKSGDWKKREKNLSKAYLALLKMHNRLRLTEPVKEAIQPFYNRPYQVPHAERVVDSLVKAIASPAVLALPKHVGAVGQFVRSTDVGESPENCLKLKNIYGER